MHRILMRRGGGVMQCWSAARCYSHTGQALSAGVARGIDVAARELCEATSRTKTDLARM